MDQLKQKELKAMIVELEKIRGRHTELVTVYIPAGFSLNKVVEQIRSEQSTAQNIKSKSVRKNVLSALERIMQHLKLYKQTPPNGLVIFCGNVSDKEGVDDIELWTIEPHEPVKTRLYRCDQTFILDPLKDMVREREIYGIIVVDKSNAAIGVLKGKKVSLLKNLDSIVPGKTKAGGWCVHEDTLIPMENGSVVPIKDIGESSFFSFDFKSNRAMSTRHNHYFQRTAKKSIKIVTHQPRIELVTTPEHKFFVIGEDGISEKHAGNLENGDRLLSVKRIEVRGRKAYLEGKAFPKVINKEFAQFLGYLIGDGTVERDRITLFDSDPKMLGIYQNLSNRAFGIEGSLKNREGKNYWHLRICNRELVKALQEHFPEAVRSHEKDIPPAIFTLENDVLAGFLRGLFDAEGYVNSSSNRIGITTNRERMMRSLQLMLLRFGILSSFCPVSGKSFAKKQKYSVTIDDRESLERFSSQIGFSGRKAKELGLIIKKRDKMSRVDQVPIDGRYVRNLAKSLRMNSSDFPEAGTMYLLGNRQMSRQVFENNVIKKIENRIQELSSSPESIHELRKLVRIQYNEIARILGVSTSTVFGNMKNGWNIRATRKVMEDERKKMIREGEDVLKELRNALHSDAISVKIGSITPMKSSGLFYDMEIPKYQNFIANGLIIHNSANRYARIREGLLHDFLKKVGEVATANFKQLPELKGVIIGGPGPIKEQFAEGDFLEYTIKGKVLGIVNTSYTGEYGLKEAVDRSEDLIAEASVIREKKLLDRFFAELEKDSGLAVYGFFETANALKAGNIELLLISEEFDYVRTNFECPSCGYKAEKIVNRKQIDEQKCPECNSRLVVREEKEITESIIKTAEEMGTQVEIISTETQRGEQLKELGGIGGILRYRKE